MLGETLLGQNEYKEAEPLLIDGYQGLKARENILPPALSHLLPDAGERLVQLYDRCEKPDQALEWRQTLQQLRTE